MYCISETDAKGYVHSIDNLVIEYYVKQSLRSTLEEITTWKDKSTNYWERLNCNACVKYNFYRDHIHLDDGIYLSLGHYTDYDADKKIYRLIPMLKVEVNPNKHFEKETFRLLLDFIKDHCDAGEIRRYDYAIDIPVLPDKVQVFKTKKETGHYKNTRFYGQRNKNGYCRIYNKALESGLEKPLTRVEHVCDTRCRRSFEKFCVAGDSGIDETEKLTSTASVIVELCKQVKALGGDYSQILMKLDKRTRYKIEPFLSCGYEEYVYSDEILDRLLEKYETMFYIDEIKVDADGFSHYDGRNPFDGENPFE